MAAGAGSVLGDLRHEGHAQLHLRGHLFQALLVDRVAVGHRQHVGVAHVQLVLTGAPLPLGAFDWDAGVPEVTARGGVECLLARRQQRMVVLDVPADGLEVRVAAGGGVAVRAAEDVVLEFRAGPHGVAHIPRPLYLPAQHRPRRHGRGPVRGVVDVAQDQRRAVQPGRPPQRLHLRRQVDVAVPLLPAGEGVPGDRLHLHIDGQQVVAGVGAAIGDLVEEELGVEALAEQAAVEVRERDHHGLDIAAFDQFAEALPRQHAAHLAHAVAPSRCSPHPRLRRRAPSRLAGGASYKIFNERTGTPFNDLQYPTDSVLLAALWRIRYKLSFRDVAELMLQRGYEVTHETIRGPGGAFRSPDR